MKDIEYRIMEQQVNKEKMNRDFKNKIDDLPQFMKLTDLLDMYPERVVDEHLDTIATTDYDGTYITGDNYTKDVIDKEVEILYSVTVEHRNKITNEVEYNYTYPAVKIIENDNNDLNK